MIHRENEKYFYTMSYRDKDKPAASPVYRKNSVTDEIESALRTINGETTAQSDIHRLGWVPEPWAGVHWFANIPFLLILLRGLLFMREAWQLIRNHPKYKDLSPKERRLRLITSLIGGVIAIGSYIVNLLLHLRIGLLGLTTAVLWTPVVLTLIGICFYGMTLFRDIYHLKQINKHIEIIRDSLIDSENIPEDTLRMKHYAEERSKLIKDISFGAIGTIGTILALGVSIASLAAAAPALGGLYVLAAVLVTISTLPSAYSLIKKIAKGISNYRKRKAQMDILPVPRAHSADNLLDPMRVQEPARKLDRSLCPMKCLFYRRPQVIPAPEIVIDHEPLSPRLLSRVDSDHSLSRRHVRSIFPLSQQNDEKMLDNDDPNRFVLQ